MSPYFVKLHTCVIVLLSKVKNKTFLKKININKEGPFFLENCGMESNISAIFKAPVWLSQWSMGLSISGSCV